MDFSLFHQKELINRLRGEMRVGKARSPRQGRNGLKEIMGFKGEGLGDLVGKC